MHIVDVLTKTPIKDSLRQRAERDDKWRPFLHKLHDLVSFLESVSPSIQLQGFLSTGFPEIWISNDNSSMEIGVDYYGERATSSDPRLHFRIDIQRDGKIAESPRTSNPQEVARQIRLTFSLL